MRFPIAQRVERSHVQRQTRRERLVPIPNHTDHNRYIFSSAYFIGPRRDNLPSRLPPTKSIPSSVALCMNGVLAVVCSLIPLARLASASENF